MHSFMTKLYLLAAKAPEYFIVVYKYFHNAHVFLVAHSHLKNYSSLQISWIHKHKDEILHTPLQYCKLKQSVILSLKYLIRTKTSPSDLA